MPASRMFRSLAFAALLLLAACATRPINPPILHYNTNTTAQYETPKWNRERRQDFVILAFSGGGTRAAAFSYGVLEALRRIEVVGRSGNPVRLLDEVNVITGVSGGGFTALAYGLYGERLFDIYERDFLKRNVQRELVTRIANPLNWGKLLSRGYGRSELAAQLYDKILFHGATFADLERTPGPIIAVSATELSSGSRLVFTPQNFNVMCADLRPISLSRAAAASSAVPVLLSPITLNNYGGSCGYTEPVWLAPFTELADAPRPVGRVLKRLQEIRGLGNAKNDPYFHLVDGGVSDNLALRGVLDFIETFEALQEAGQPTPIDNVQRIVIFVVNSMSAPSNTWNRSENPPSSVTILTKSIRIPIERYSGESIELLKDISARWASMRAVRASATFASSEIPKVTYAEKSPDAEIYVIDVSFAALKDHAERDYLNELATAFALPDEAVDRLRAAALTLILDSPEFQQMLEDAGAHLIVLPPPLPSAE
ncbi:patatin-like phospholipase family protein [Paraburkholderia oxyphila]|uniref:patatin-like phospholipase family protein n=1 Tax=Paraburkholderia oxyphila TaxID=614212 RepID=UPI000A4A7BC4|nr:patatin-like phospholipase family protein [Paraburkholderia oxyphila]